VGKYLPNRYKEKHTEKKIYKGMENTHEGRDYY